MRTLDHELVRAGREIRAAAEESRIRGWGGPPSRTFSRVATASLAALAMIAAVGIPALWLRAANQTPAAPATSVPQNLTIREPTAEASTSTSEPAVVPAPPLVSTIELSVDPTEVVLGDSVRISGVAEPVPVEGARSLTSVYLIAAPTATLVDELCRMRIATDGGFSCTALIEEGGRFSSVTPGTYWIAVGEPWNVVRGTELTVREISS